MNKFSGNLWLCCNVQGVSWLIFLNSNLAPRPCIRNNQLCWITTTFTGVGRDSTFYLLTEQSRAQKSYTLMTHATGLNKQSDDLAESSEHPWKGFHLEPGPLRKFLLPPLVGMSPPARYWRCHPVQRYFECFHASHCLHHQRIINRPYIAITF